MGNCCSVLAGSGSKNKNTAASKEAQHNAPKSEADKALPVSVDSPHTQNLEINEIELVAKQPVKETVKETPVEERVVAPIEDKVEIVQQQDEERVVELAEIKEELEVKEEIVIKEEPVEVAVEVEVKDVVVEEAANELVVDEPVKEPTKTESQDEEGQQTLSVELPTHLRKYIIGPKGQFIKDIQSQSDTTINTDESDPKFITIKANNSSDAEKAKELLMKKLHECGWVFDADKGEYVEHGESHQSYQKSRELADMHAQKRAECFEKSKQAFEAGDKKLAKELSEEGKRHGELMEQANKQAIKEILAHNDKGPNTIDMHGLRVAEALEALEEKIKEMEKPQVLTVITGAGNHSENNNAKIKPAVVEFLRKNNYEFEELNNGSYSVQLQ